MGEKGINGLGSIGNLVGGFMALALATQCLAMFNSNSDFVKNDDLLYVKDNFFENKYRCSLIKKDSLKDLKQIKRYY